MSVAAVDENGISVPLVVIGGNLQISKELDKSPVPSLKYEDGVTAKAAAALFTTSDISFLGLYYDSHTFVKSAGTEAATVTIKYTTKGGVIIISGLTGETIAVNGAVSGVSAGAIWVTNSAGALVQATALGNGTYWLHLG